MKPTATKSVVNPTMFNLECAATGCGSLKQRLRWMSRAFAGLLFALGLSAHALAQTTRYVDNIAACDGLLPCYTTIMDAVNAAAAFDVIEVFPGVYPGNVTFTSKSDIVLRAHREGRPAPTPVIEGGVTLEQTSGIEIRDFILGGVTGYEAQGATIQGNMIEGSVWLSSCGPTTEVKDNIFLGAGFQCPRGGAVVEHNTFRNGRISFGESSGFAADAIVRHNVLLGGGIVLAGERVQRSIVEANRIDGGDILVGNGAPQVSENTIRRNVVRKGGIKLAGTIGSNAIVANFVSGNTGDGILVANTFGFGGGNVIMFNTSIENTGCDINETGVPHYPNVWKGDRFATRCGGATE